MRDAERMEVERQQRVVAARQEHSAQVARAEAEALKRNEAISAHIRGIAERKQENVEKYLRQVLKRLPLPKDFPHQADVTFNPRTEHAVVRFELPSREVVPTVATYKYLSTKDEIRSTARPKNEVSTLYRSVISQVALLCVRDILNGDSALNAIGFNGHVHATNPATGAQEYPCIISLNVERSTFPPDENLMKVTPEACVRHLNAIVSNHPYDLEPIEPILDFDLSKFSFVEGFDAVSTLDSRPDLMDMSYTNFEHLVRQIFEAQGAEGWTTQQSNDDGVDAVIVQRKALMGGLSIVQAKRYSKVIGVSHIRELAGAMEEKKAGWGILITTSWFTSGCWEKARDHGRMELIDGDRLKYLIKEYLHKDVLIGIPNRPKSQPGR
jgi:restriction system protein